MQGYDSAPSRNATSNAGKKCPPVKPPKKAPAAGLIRKAMNR